jgi:ABC-type oligopeptide transport system substrate-binding subunit/DNA-binding SARP family transcriptional activator
MSRLALFLLGSPRLELDGETLEVGRRKAIALIAYLALTGHGHSRDALATLLWPESDQVAARANLRRTLSALNMALSGPWLEVDRETIGLNPDADFWFDVEAFRQRLATWREHGHPESEVCPACLSSLAEAVDLYKDDFLAGFSLRDSPEFDDWQFFQAESLRRDLAGALERLVRAHRDRGEYALAISDARRWLRLDPLHEPAHRRLMQLYACSDQRPAALRQYQECVRVLEEELGASPSPKTTALYERIQAGELSSEVAAPAAPPAPHPFLASMLPPSRPAAPFVGREDELAQLKQRLDVALAAGGHVAFVAGEAGSGKTALVHEFARRAQEEAADLIVAIGNCNAYTGLGDPYLPFRDILGLLMGDVETRWTQGMITTENARRLWAILPASLEALLGAGPNLVGSLVPATLLAARAAALGPGQSDWLDRLEKLLERQTEGDSGPGLAQSDLFEQYTHLLQSLARQQPLLLVVDDAQWADVASINLLFHLSRQLAGGRILLLVTYRPDDVAMGRGGTRHPLEPVVNELKRTYGDVWIDLDPAMGRHFIDALLDIEPNRLGEEFRAAFFRQTQGHPLFTVELLRAMQEAGSILRDEEGRWVEGPALNWGALPARVEAVIEERIGRLEAGLRGILAVASVEGETFTAQVVARVQGLGERPLLGALSQELERRHHLVQAQGEVQVNHHFLSRYRFTHTMFQQYLYNTFSPGERRLLHGEVAAALEDLYQGEGEELTVQLARHYAEAGQAEQAVDYLLRAGDRARGLYAHQEAIDFYQQALAFLKERGSYERAARTLMKLGLTYHLAFDFPRARQAYQEGFALWQRAGTGQAPAQPAAPHPLRMIWFDPLTLDPAMSEDDTSNVIIHHLFGGLVTLNAELDVVPELAQSWEVLEAGGRYVFHLRGDVLWSDGHPVTAGDFVYAWKRILNPALGSPNAGYLFDIKGARACHQGQKSGPDQVGVRALDPMTLLVELEGPTGYFPQLLTQPALFPVPRHAVEAYGEAWTEMEHLVTNGPFILALWQPGHSMLLTRNPEYRGQFSGNVEEIALTLNVLEPAHGLARYEADSLDIVYLPPTPEASYMRQRHAAEYFSAPTLNTQCIAFDLRRPPFDDRRVRRAFAMAIDKEELASVILGGHSFPATGGYIPAGMPGHSPEIGLPYEPEQARELLAEAGYPAGRNFPPVECLTRGFSGEFESDYLRSQWRQNLGIDIQWQTADWARLLERLDRDPPHLFRIGWVADYPDPDSPLRMSSHRRWAGWRNETYTELIETARRITNQAQRMKLYQQADRILVEEAALIPILYSRHHLLVKPWVHKFSLSALNCPFWKDVIIEPHA